MSVEQENKQIVSDVFAKISSGNISEMLNLLDDSCTWWIGGKPEDFPLAGKKSKQEITDILSSVIEPMPGGVNMKLKALTAEGERVAAEVESYGKAQNGKVYNNEYHFLFRIKDGKVIEVKEYLDTLHTKMTFLD